MTITASMRASSTVRGAPDPARREARPRAALQNGATTCLPSFAPGPAWPPLPCSDRLPRRSARSGSQSHSLRRLPPRRQRLQFGTLFIAQYQGRKSRTDFRSSLVVSAPIPWHNHAVLRLRTCDSGHWAWPLPELISHASVHRVVQRRFGWQPTD